MKNKKLKSFLNFFVNQDICLGISRIYNLRNEIPADSHVRFTVEFEGGVEQIRHCIPPSVYLITASGKIKIGEGTRRDFVWL